MHRALLATSLALLTSGCASIFSEQIYPVQVTSAPSAASVQITDEDGNVVYNGTTPATVKLASSAGYFDGQRYTVKFSKPGYADETFVVDSGVHGWYWGNILVGGLLGMLIIDPATGAMFDLPTKASATLKEQAPTPVVATTTEPKAGLSQHQWQQQQVQQLQQETGLSYEEYQRRYREITDSN